MSNWGVIEEREDSGRFVSFHVVPLVRIGDEDEMSAAHQLSDACPCHPFYTENDHGYIVWQHFDPTHKGARTHEDWIADIQTRREYLARTAKSRPLESKVN